MTPLEAASQMVQLEEDVIPEWYLVIVGHLRPDMNQAFKYHISGDADMASVVFTIETIKQRILSME